MTIGISCRENFYRTAAKWTIQANNPDGKQILMNAILIAVFQSAVLMPIGQTLFELVGITAYSDRW